MDEERPLDQMRRPAGHHGSDRRVRERHGNKSEENSDQKGNKKDEVVSITKQQNEWKNWEIGLPEQFLQKGDTVLLDFTATWCITCQVNKVRVLEDEQLIDLFAEKNIILIRADWTKQNKEIENEIKKYGRVGVPLNVLLRPGQAPFIFSEWLDKEEIVELLID